MTIKFGKYRFDLFLEANVYVQEHICKDFASKGRYKPILHSLQTFRSTTTRVARVGKKILLSCSLVLHSDVYVRNSGIPLP